MMKSSITDNPRNVSLGDKDSFGIGPFENGLTKFIKNSSTPITIALQGEWGSGKTSLMNSLKKSLSDTKDFTYHSIWLNTWEYALMKDAQSTLMDIITGLIQETSNIANIDKAATNKLLGKLWTGIKDTSKVVAKNTLDKAIDGAGSVIDSFSVKGKSSISEVRVELEEIIEACIQKDNKRGFIFFIDDLDRIDPPIAVQLLELLKNIFTLKNCVFILAIDYDVVIKGLEPKFGKLSEVNEREFRSFFDKIIQVPFSMPVSNYNIDEFLKDSLLGINYINEAHAKDDKLIAKFSEISNLSVGKNPRALKRLMNSLSLISCINYEKDNAPENEQLNEELELLVNFALVSMQIAYPQVYRLLSLHSGFDEWNESVALQMNLKPLDPDGIEKLNKTEEFDEEWEKVLFRLCETDHYLKKRALNISRLLNSLKVSITDSGEDIEDLIGSVISLSSVTNLEAFDKIEVHYHKGNLLKQLRGLLIPQLKSELPEISKFIKPQGKRVQSNAYIKFTKKDWGHWIKLSSKPYEGKIRLSMVTNKIMAPAKKNKTFQDVIKEVGLESEFLTLESDYNSYISSYPDFESKKLYDGIITRNRSFVLNIYAYIALSDPDAFYSQESIEKIGAVIKEMYQFSVRLEELKEKIKVFYSEK